MYKFENCILGGASCCDDEGVREGAKGEGAQGEGAGDRAGGEEAAGKGEGGG